MAIDVGKILMKTYQISNQFSWKSLYQEHPCSMYIYFNRCNNSANFNSKLKVKNEMFEFQLIFMSCNTIFNIPMFSVPLLSYYY